MVKSRSPSRVRIDRPVGPSTPGPWGLVADPGVVSVFGRPKTWTDPVESPSLRRLSMENSVPKSTLLVWRHLGEQDLDQDLADRLVQFLDDRLDLVVVLRGGHAQQRVGVRIGLEVGLVGEVVAVRRGGGRPLPVAPPVAPPRPALPAALELLTAPRAGALLLQGRHLREQVVQDRHEVGRVGVLERVDEDPPLLLRVLVQFLDDLGDDLQRLRRTADHDGVRPRVGRGDHRHVRDAAAALPLPWVVCPPIMPPPPPTESAESPMPPR